MKEELYLIVNGERQQLDLNTPSDITLEYVNNLFNDLSKIEVSHSYTFKLPNTANNSRLLDYANDVRHKSYYTSYKSQVEYVIDGVTLFNDGNLYITGFENDAYQAVMTWDVLEGLQSLNSKNLSLPDLGEVLQDGDYDYIGDELSNYEKDKVVSTGDDFTKESDYDSSLPSIRTMQPAGVSLFGNNIKPSYIIANSYSEFTWRTNYIVLDDGDKRYIDPYPAPVVPVNYLLNVISNSFGLNLEFDGTSTEKMCLPLVKVEASDMLCRLNYSEISFKPYRTDEYPKMVVTDVNNYPNINPMSLGTDGTAVNYLSLTFNPYNAYQIGLDGKIEVYTTDYYNGVSDDMPRLVLEMHDAGSEEWEGWEISAEVHGYLSGGEQIGGKYLRRYVFDFRESEGNENLKSENVLQVRTRIRFLKPSDDEIIPVYVVSGTLKMYFIYTNETWGIKTNLFANLPDISCMDFIKSMCYILGGYPCPTKNGGIKIIRYKDIQEAISNNNIYDWSNKVYDKTPDFKELDISYTSSDIQSSDLARKNYYLMKNDELDDFGKPKVKEPTDDVYEDGYAYFDVENEILDEFKTIYQFPYYGAFVANGKIHRAITGNNQDRWKIKDIYYSGYLYTVDESKPMLCIVEPQETDKYEMVIEEEEGQVEGETYQTIVPEYIGAGDVYLTTRIWSIKDNLKDVEEYSLMANIFNNPCLVTEELNLNAYDLATLDYTKPIYIDKYNSNFVLKKLQFSPSGTCKAELLKIPNE